ncbi:hypothetical protein ABTK71_19425, partial [Acinetobacter baumannii]
STAPVDLYDVFSSVAKRFEIWTELTPLCSVEDVVVIIHGKHHLSRISMDLGTPPIVTEVQGLVGDSIDFIAFDPNDNPTWGNPVQPKRTAEY